jgi:hypothetical protein
MSRTIADYEFNRAISLADAVGNLISKAAAANMPEVQTDVNALVQNMTAYASELIGKAEEPQAPETPEVPDAPETPTE